MDRPERGCGGKGRGGVGWVASVTIDLPHDDRPLRSPVADHLVPYLGRPDRALRGRSRRPVRVDVNLVWPTAERPWITAYTVGMSSRPMTVPREVADRCSPFAELFLRLPPTWVPERVCPLCVLPRRERDPLADGRTSKPFEWLVELASHPHACRTFLGRGHSLTYADGAPLEEGLPFTGFLLDSGWDDAGDRPISPMRRDDGASVDFLALVPLHAAELRALGDGRRREALDALDTAHVTELFDPARPSCV